MPLLPSWLRTLKTFLERPNNPRRRRRTARRLGLEVLEARTVPSVTAVDGFQTQVSSIGTGSQTLSAGSYQAVSSLQVTVPADTVGLVDFGFHAQLHSYSSSDQVFAHIVIDNDFRPDHLPIYYRVNLTDNGYGSDGTLSLTDQVVLPVGSHTIHVEIESTAVAAGRNGQDLLVIAPVLHADVYDMVEGRSAADGYQTRSLANPPLAGDDYQYVKAGSYQTVSILFLTVDSAKTGLFDLGYQAIVDSYSANDQVKVRYLIDGRLDPNDLAVTPGKGTGYDSILDLTKDTGDNDGTLSFTHQLTLAPGSHFISVQVESTAVKAGGGGHDLLVESPDFHLTGYNKLDGQTAADGYQTQTPSHPSPNDSPLLQIDAAGSYQTVSGLQVTVDAGKTGLFDLGFDAQLHSYSANDRVTVRYLIDGQVNPSNSVGYDSTVDLADHGYGAYGSLSFTQQVTLAPGPHTISVQVESQASNGGTDLGVSSPVLHLTGYNVVNVEYVAAQLDGSGVWRCSTQTGPARLTTANASLVAADDRGDVVAAFQGGGVWHYGDAGGWRQLTPADASQVSIAGSGIVAVEIPDSGVWRYEAVGGWRQLTHADASSIAVDASGDVVASFVGGGVWRYEDAGDWRQLTPADASLVSIAGNGIVAAEFQGGGVWRYGDAGGWMRLTPADASSIAVDAAGDVAAEIQGSGVWRYGDAGGWMQLTPADASEVVIDSGGNVTAEIQGSGVWRYNKAGWRQLTPVDASSLGA